MLELDHVGFSYGKRLILDNASALFEEGSTTAIMGLPAQERPLCCV